MVTLAVGAPYRQLLCGIISPYSYECLFRVILSVKLIGFRQAAPSTDLALFFEASRHGDGEQEAA